MDAKDWKAAVQMYRGAGQWEDALRVAKAHGGPAAVKQVRAPDAPLSPLPPHLATDAEGVLRVLHAEAVMGAAVGAVVDRQSEPGGQEGGEGVRREEAACA